MEIKDTIIIAKEFKDNPGARERADGPNSGQEFLEDILLARFNVCTTYIFKIFTKVF